MPEIIHDTTRLRVGDRVRLTYEVFVGYVEDDYLESASGQDFTLDQEAGLARIELMDRIELPTTPGVYLDTRNAAWTLDANGTWRCGVGSGSPMTFQPLRFVGSLPA